MTVKTNDIEKANANVMAAFTILEASSPKNTGKVKSPGDPNE